uniref:Uncharacterized protein n=1 Tax=Anguilla anguilla TaxID=7936 RepID=A0A0E9PE96_ANGAN
MLYCLQFYLNIIFHIIFPFCALRLKK